MFPNEVVFQFNTYIIAVLVIFYLQMNHGIPVTEIIWTLPNATEHTEDFKVIPRKFFDFYGHAYQLYSHVISAQIGQWQLLKGNGKQQTLSSAEQRLVHCVTQMNFSGLKDTEVINISLRFRLRSGIENNPPCWTKCTMYVQDLVRPHINITAEVPRKAAENFQHMCRLFANNTIQ